MKRQPKVQIFKNARGKWQWRLRYGNGRISCTPHEDFASKRNAMQNLERTRAAFRHVSWISPESLVEVVE